MESSELRIFRAVALEGSITKAAASLGYVQSNVTARIQQLEAELKTPLFYRQRGMILTPAGEKLLIYAKQILHLLDEAGKSLSESAIPSGNLSIGAITASPRFIFRRFWPVIINPILRWICRCSPEQQRNWSTRCCIMNWTGPL